MTAALTSGQCTKKATKLYLQGHQTSKGQAKPAFLSHESNERWHGNTQSCGITEPKGEPEIEGVNQKLTAEDVAEAKITA
jgi:hypothetical protein